MINIGVVGYGYWGPNIVRNFNSIRDSRVVAVCDKNTEVLIAVNKMSMKQCHVQTATQ